MDSTQNFGLYRPEEGSLDWHVPLNENFGAIDRRLPIIDTYANRNNYSPDDRQTFLAEDLGLWLCYDASQSAWFSAEPFTVIDDSNIQEKLNLAADMVGTDADRQRITVRLREGMTVDTGSTITVPPGVFLDGSKATFEPSSDYDGFFVDNGAQIHVRAITEPSYTSRVVYADTGESTYGKYTGDTTDGGNVFNRGCKIHVEHVNPNPGSPPTTETDRGTSVELYARNANSGTTGFGTDVEVEVWSYNISTAFRAKAASDGYVNPLVKISSTWCHTALKAEGPGDANLIAKGEIQGGLGAEYGIRNDGAGGTPQFEGFLWDPATYDTAALAGPVSVRSAEPARHFIGHTDGSHYQTVISLGWNLGWSMYSGGSDTAIRYKMDIGGNFILAQSTDGRSFENFARFEPDTGNLVLAGSVVQDGSP